MRRFAAIAIPAAAIVLAAGAARADTMPQLDFANHLLVSQVVWGAIIFAAFYFLLARWGLPKVASVLELRASTIAADLDQARAAKQAADQAVADLTAARQKAYADSQAAIAEATAKAKADSASRAAEQSQKLDRQLAESEARIGASRAEAMGRLQDMATDAAEAVVTRLTGHEPGRDRVREAVGHAMAQGA